MFLANIPLHPPVPIMEGYKSYKVINNHTNVTWKLEEFVYRGHCAAGWVWGPLPVQSFDRALLYIQLIRTQSTVGESWKISKHMKWGKAVGLGELTLRAETLTDRPLRCKWKQPGWSSENTQKWAEITALHHSDPPILSKSFKESMPSSSNEAQSKRLNLL